MDALLVQEVLPFLPLGGHNGVESGLRGLELFPSPALRHLVLCQPGTYFFQFVPGFPDALFPGAFLGFLRLGVLGRLSVVMVGVSQLVQTDGDPGQAFHALLRFIRHLAWERFADFVNLIAKLPAFPGRGIPISRGKPSAKLGRPFPRPILKLIQRGTAAFHRAGRPLVHRFPAADDSGFAGARRQSCRHPPPSDDGFQGKGRDVGKGGRAGGVELSQ